MKFKVIRSGQLQYISIYDLLVGDIMLIEQGNVMPVDAIIISSTELTVDEFLQTGHKQFTFKRPLQTPINCQEKANPFLFSGSDVLTGTCFCLVCAVGKNSFIGQYKSELQENTKTHNDNNSTLSKKTEEFVFLRAKTGIQWSCLVFVILFIWMVFKFYDDFFQMKTYLIANQQILNTLGFLVLTIPDGLFVTLKVTITQTAKKLRKYNILIRDISAFEAMGQITTICSDKTGTLTQNQMSLSELFLGGTMYNVSEKNKINPQLIQLFCEGICINSAAYPRKIQGKYEHNGNETECALLEFAYQCGYKYESYRPSPNVYILLYNDW